MDVLVTSTRLGKGSQMRSELPLQIHSSSAVTQASDSIIPASFLGYYWVYVYTSFTYGFGNTGGTPLWPPILDFLGEPSPILSPHERPWFAKCMAKLDLILYSGKISKYVISQIKRKSFGPDFLLWKR